MIPHTFSRRMSVNDQDLENTSYVVDHFGGREGGGVEGKTAGKRG